MGVDKRALPALPGKEGAPRDESRANTMLTHDRGETTAVVFAANDVL